MRCDEAPEGSDKGCEATRARGTAGVAVTVTGQGMVALPDATPDPGVPAEPTRMWHESVSTVGSVIMIRRGRRTLA